MSEKLPLLTWDAWLLEDYEDYDKELFDTLHAIDENVRIRYPGMRSTLGGVVTLTARLLDEGGEQHIVRSVGRYDTPSMTGLEPKTHGRVIRDTLLFALLKNIDQEAST